MRNRLTRRQIIVSTSLLFLSSTLVTQSGVAFSMPKNFNATNLKTVQMGSEALQTFFGIRSRGLPFPAGTTENLAVPTFGPNVPVHNATSYQALVDGFSIDLECEVVLPVNAGNIGPLDWIRLNAPFFAINISTPACKIDQVVVGQGPDQFDEVTRLEQYQGWWGNYTCNDGVSSDLLLPGTVPVKPDFTDHRMVMTTSLVKWNTTSFENRRVWLDSFATILCKPTYRMDKYRVTMLQNLTDSDVSFDTIRLAQTSSRLSGLSEGDLVPILKTVASAQQSLGSEGIVTTVGSTSIVRAPDQIFRLMQLMKGDSDLHEFMNGTILSEFGQRAFKGVWSQIASQYLLQPKEEAITGSVESVQLRVQVSPVSSGILMGLLGLLFALSLLQVRIRPRNVTPREPQTTSAVATLLAASPDIVAWLLQSVLDRNLQSRTATDQPRFCSRRYSDKFRIYGTFDMASKDDVQTNIESESKHFKWWQPVAFTTWYAILAIAVPLVISAVLQITQYISDAKYGLINMNGNETRTILITSLPAAVLAGLAAMFTALHVATSDIIPFLNLRRRASSATASISVNLTVKSYIEGVIWSVNHPNVAFFFSCSAALVASLLTVVSSGLLFIEDIPRQDTVNISRTDLFDLGLNGNDLSSGDNLAAATTNLLVYQNLSFPQWTFQDLVFPTLQHPNPIFARHFEEGSQLQLELPALRASLECAEVNPEDIINVPSLSLNAGSGRADVSFDAKPNKLCTDINNQSLLQPDFMELAYNVPYNGSRILVGSFEDQGASLRSSNASGAFDVISKVKGCRTQSLSFGSLTAHLPTGQNANASILPLNFEQDLKVFSCFQKIQTVMTKVQFTMPDFAIDPHLPPVPMESTAGFLKSPYYAGDDFAFRITENIRGSFPTTGEGLNDLDPFLLALTESNFGVQLSDLTDENKSSNLLDAANKLYGIYMAQAINANFRAKLADEESASSDSGPLIYGATLVNNHVSHLKQSNQVKYALQGMLVLMAAFASIIYLCSDTTEILRHNPGSIVGKMILLAQSKLISIIPPNSEWNTPKDDLKMWESLLFRLAWFEVNPGNHYFGVDLDPNQNGRAP